MSEMNKQELLENLKGLRDSYPNDDGHAGIRQGLLIAIGAVEQLGEPEKVVIPQFVAESFEKAKGGNWFAEQLIRAMYNSSDEVGYWLEVPSNEKLLLRAWLDGYKVEKVVIPRFVATFIEDSRNKVGNIVTAIWEMYEYEYRRVYEWALEDGNDEVLMKAFVNGYEIEKEKLYRVIIPTKDTAWDYYYLDQDGGINMAYSLKYVECHTEAFIRSVSDDLWQFAVEVTE